jgi:acetyltransferase-like isoleucine patch superfamily enzyme
MNVYNNTRIGDNSIFGQNSVVIDGEHTNHNNCWKNSPIRSSPIKIHKNVLIGTNCIILKGSEIGENTLIGAGTIVSNKKIKPNSVYINKRKGTYL